MSATGMGVTRMGATRMGATAWAPLAARPPVRISKCLNTIQCTRHPDLSLHGPHWRTSRQWRPHEDSSGPTVVRGLASERTTTQVRSVLVLAFRLLLPLVFRALTLLAHIRGGLQYFLEILHGLAGFLLRRVA